MQCSPISPSPDALEGEHTAATEGEQRYREAAMALVRRTINVIALDKAGELCVGVSTSGYPFKYPGRIGDSAICGAGNYCDLRYGGAACTGRGEMAIRVVGARAIVDGIAAGLEPGESCRAMLREAAALDDPFAAELRALALCPDGRHGGAAGQPGATYAVTRPGDDTAQILPRLLAS